MYGDGSSYALLSGPGRIISPTVAVVSPYVVAIVRTLYARSYGCGGSPPRTVSVCTMHFAVLALLALAIDQLGPGRHYCQYSAGRGRAAPGKGVHHAHMSAVGAVNYGGCRCVAVAKTTGSAHLQ